ncbi:translation initiation factor IF-2 [bacterium BMS3Abin05]|nr:translation initiation factor IF-2 [bacterium BMS3Abin05]GBE28151.1 translation initiation factor IF-2 [bacterium BMS3Bbin03]
MEVVEEKIVQTKKRKVRVFQVAKEFNISIESILKFLKLQKYPVKNQMSLISDEMYLELSAKFGKEKAPIKTAELDYQKKLREKHQQEELRKQFINKEIEELVTSVPGPIVIEKKKVKPVKKKPVEPKEPEKKAAKKEDKRLESILASEVTTTEHYIPEKEKPKREKAPKISEGKAPGEKEKKTQPKTEAGPKVRVHMISKDEKKDKEEKAKAPGEELKKKKKKKRKERLKEEAAKRAQEKGRKRKKKEPKHKISAEEVEAAVKRTMAAMEEKSGRPKHRKKVAQNEEDSVEEAKNILRVSEFISVGELARAMDVEPNEVIRGLMSLGMLVSINQRLDMDTIITIADEFGFDVEPQEEYGVEITEQLDQEDEDESKLEPRPPIVTIMGHVDHGKTSLLDFIRRSKIVAGEVGGITQHIGAYVVEIDGKRVTFLDTPGHEAFTAMRARGAQVTDIVILIVAADDSVMPQTIEAINHAKAADVPIIVAINKIDKPNANIDLVKKQLADAGILIEEWGGHYPSADISAKTGQNIDQLLELILLQAEVLELKANPHRPARGIILESRLDKGKGAVATVLVQTGTLKVGTPVIAGHHHGKIRAMYDERGKRVTSVGPSIPAQVVGFSDVPGTGDVLYALKSDREAKEISAKRHQLKREQELRTQGPISLDEFSKRVKQMKLKELKLILKADVMGSAEALSDALMQLSNEEVKVNIIHKNVGAISETDVLLAAASDAIVIGFQVRPNPKAWDVARLEGVDIQLYSIIYKAIEDIKLALEGMLQPEEKEEVLGDAEVREVFRIPKIGTIAGCYVVSGKIKRNDRVRVLREGKMVYEGEIASLKRFKDDVKEVASGYECGIGVAGFNDIKESDILETYQIIKIKKHL